MWSGYWETSNDGMEPQGWSRGQPLTSPSLKEWEEQGGRNLEAARARWRGPLDRSCDLQLLEAFSWFEPSPRARCPLRPAAEASLHGAKKDGEKGGQQTWTGE